MWTIGITQRGAWMFGYIRVVIGVGTRYFGTFRQIWVGFGQIGLGLIGISLIGIGFGQIGIGLGLIGFGIGLIGVGFRRILVRFPGGRIGMLGRFGRIRTQWRRFGGLPRSWTAGWRRWGCRLCHRVAVFLLLPRILCQGGPANDLRIIRVKQCPGPVIDFLTDPDVNGIISLCHNRQIDRPLPGVAVDDGTRKYQWWIKDHNMEDLTNPLSYRYQGDGTCMILLYSESWYWRGEIPAIFLNVLEK